MQSYKGDQISNVIALRIYFSSYQFTDIRNGYELLVSAL